MKGRPKKLNPSQVGDILGLLSESVDGGVIAGLMGVSDSTISDIRRGRAYTEVTDSHPLMAKVKAMPKDSSKSKRGIILREEGQGWRYDDAGELIDYAIDPIWYRLMGMWR